jgi:hypothetical protein
VRAALARAPAPSRLAPVSGNDWMNFSSEDKLRRFGADPRLDNGGTQ